MLGDTLNDAEVLATRVLLATPNLFCIIKALKYKNDSETINATGHVLAGIILLGLLVSSKRILLGVTPVEIDSGTVYEDGNQLSRLRTHSAIDEKGVSDKSKLS